MAVLEPGILGAPPERWQHGQELLPRGVRRLREPVARGVQAVATGVQTLRDGKAIGDAEVTAADRFLKDYIFGIEGVRDPLASLGVRQRVKVDKWHGVQLARAEAITRHREIADTIGPVMTRWLVDFVVIELSLAAMQREHMPGELNGRLDMRGRMTAILLLLSRLYAAIDKRRKRDAP